MTKDLRASQQRDITTKYVVLWEKLFFGQGKSFQLPLGKIAILILCQVLNTITVLDFAALQYITSHPSVLPS